MALTELPEFRVRPNRVQFAHGGARENAWSPSLDGALTEDAFLAAVGTANEFAAEAFFGPAFFGVRLTGSPEPLAGQLKEFAHAARAANDGSDFFHRWSASNGNDRWGRHVDFAEIGAVNAWRSVGATRVPWPLPGALDVPAFAAQLNSTALGTNRTHPKAIEFGCATPLPHWFGLPISAATAC